MTSPSETCPNHPKEPQLSYLQAHADADRRLKRHEQQVRCGRCGLWIWREFMTNLEGAITEGQWRRIRK